MKGFVLSVVALVVLGTAIQVDAAPAKGYLSAQEIKNLLDQYSNNPIPLQEMRKIMGSPGRMTTRRIDEGMGGPPDVIFWTFEDYGTTLYFYYDKKNSVLTAFFILQHHESPALRDSAYEKMVEDFSRIVGKPSLLVDDKNITTWSLPQEKVLLIDKNVETHIVSFIGLRGITIMLR
jgi:hypothetical protein